MLTCMHMNCRAALHGVCLWAAGAEGVLRQHYKIAVRNLKPVQPFMLRQQPLSRVHDAFGRITVVRHERKDVVCHDALQTTV